MRPIIPLAIFLFSLPAFAQVPPSLLKREHDLAVSKYEASLKFVDMDSSKAKCTTPGARAFLKVDERIVYTSRIYWSDGGLMNRVLSCNLAILRARANNAPLKVDVDHGEFRADPTKDNIFHVTNLDEVDCHSKTLGHGTISIQGLPFAYQPLIGNKCQDAVNAAKVIHGAVDFDLSTGKILPVPLDDKAVPARPETAAQESAPAVQLHELPVSMPTRLDQPSEPKEVSGTL